MLNIYYIKLYILYTHTCIYIYEYIYLYVCIYMCDLYVYMYVTTTGSRTPASLNN